MFGLTMQYNSGSMINKIGRSMCLRSAFHASCGAFTKYAGSSWYSSREYVQNVLNTSAMRQMSLRR